MSTIGALVTAALVVFFAWLCTRYDAGTGLTWQHARRDRDGGQLAWALLGLLTRSRRVCPANAHGALIWHTRPRWAICEDSACREDRASNGACWCGKRPDATYPGGQGTGKSGSAQRATGSLRGMKCAKAHQPPAATKPRPASPVAGPDRTAPAPPARAVPEQWTVAPKGKHHAAAPRLGLVFDPLAGRIRHAETGPMQIPAGYGSMR